MTLLLLACAGPEDTGPGPGDTAAPCRAVPWYVDEDRDGLGVGEHDDDWVELACEAPGPGYAPIRGDCFDQHEDIREDGLFLIGQALVDLSDTTTLTELSVEEPSTLVVCDGEWPLSVTATAPLTVVGESRDAVVTGAGQARPFTVTAPMTVSRLSVRDGTADDGGAIWTDSDLTLTDVRLQGNQATGSGGAVFQAGAEVQVVLDFSGVWENVAGADGGGMAIGGSLLLDASRVSQNHAGGGGGGLHLDGPGSTTLVYSEVDNNTADRGGGLDIRPPHQVLLEDSALSYNLASFGGGLATWETATLACLDSTVAENTGDTKGGGAWLLPSDGVVALSSEGCDWRGNVRQDVYNTQTAYAAVEGTWHCEGTTCDLEPL